VSVLLAGTIRIVGKFHDVIAAVAARGCFPPGANVYVTAAASQTQIGNIDILKVTTVALACVVR